MFRISLFWAILTITSNAESTASFTPNGRLTIEKPWLRATPKGVVVSAGYMKIINSDESEERLISAESDISNRVEIHSVNIKNGIVMMRRIEGGLVIKPNSELILKPGSFHIMFLGLKRPLNHGEHLSVNLNFQNSGQIKVLFKVDNQKNNFAL